MTMKKLFFLVLIGLFLTGCGTAAERAEFWKHDTMYKNWDHFIYSSDGYKKTTSDDVKKTKEQNWWGEPIKGK